MNASIVIPVYNEQESLKQLHKSIHGALDSVDGLDWKVIYVDDGSSDNSPQILEELADSDPEHITLIEFRRNFGQTAAIAAGIDHAQTCKMTPVTSL